MFSAGAELVFVCVFSRGRFRHEFYRKFTSMKTYQEECVYISGRSRSSRVGSVQFRSRHSSALLSWIIGPAPGSMRIASCQKESSTHVCGITVRPRAQVHGRASFAHFYIPSWHTWSTTITLPACRPRPRLHLRCPLKTRSTWTAWTGVARRVHGNPDPPKRSGEATLPTAVTLLKRVCLRVCLRVGVGVFLVFFVCRPALPVCIACSVCVWGLYVAGGPRGDGGGGGGIAVEGA